ncbi:hypothetical protein FACS1894108_03060 [Planctomycetales bacterium]|nr:hypothetical protein FACS1894108_03060 [Planctomycetales bacterium]
MECPFWGYGNNCKAYGTFQSDNQVEYHCRDNCQSCENFKNGGMQSKCPYFDFPNYCKV